MKNLDNIEFIWESVIERLNHNPKIQDYSMMNGFIKSLTPKLFSDNKFMILSVESDWAKEYIEKIYKAIIVEELSNLMGHNCEISIVVDANQQTYKNDSSPTSLSPVSSSLSSPSLSSSSPLSLVSEDTNTNTNNTYIESQNENAVTNENTVINNTSSHVTNRETNSGLFAGNFEERAGNSQRSQEEKSQNEDIIHSSHKSQQSQSISVNSHQINEIYNEDKRTFDNFVVADTNHFAYGAAYSVAENPGSVHNPLFIYGRSGLGKTHLLLAIKDYVNTNYRDKFVHYSSAANFVEDFVNSAQTKDFTDFAIKYRNVDLLLLDDVQTLEGKEATTDEFFKIFNEMITNRRQIVLSADRAPKEIDLDERLISRFANGVTADIQAPKYETKLKIFQNYIENRKKIDHKPELEIPNNVVNRVIELSNSNIRNLEGAASSLIVYITYGREGKKEPITVEEAEKVVSKIFFTNISNKISISDIQRVVEKNFNVDHGEILGKQRSKRISHARQVAMYLCRVMTQASYPDIGKAFNKDHSSVVKAYQKIEETRQSDKSFFNELELLKDKVISSIEERTQY